MTGTDLSVNKSQFVPVIFEPPCKNKIDTSSNGGNWNHLKIIQKIAEQRTGKAQAQGTTGNSHTGHDTHTSGRHWHARSLPYDGYRGVALTTNPHLTSRLEKE